ncbi:MAG: hypothetical protein V1809_00270 [Planctomycetota bacterium]
MIIEIVRAGEKFPDSRPCYVVGKNGVFLRKVTRLFESVSKVESLPEFEEVRETAVWTAPRIPYRLVQEALEFFRAVEAAHQSESIVLLSLEKTGWNIHVPNQTVSPCRLEYKLDGDSASKSPVGTIHSHCEMSAFFSGRDVADVIHFDGVHLVLGKIGQNVPEIAASVATGGRTIELSPETVIEGIPAAPDTVKTPHPWLAKVKMIETPVETGWDWAARRDGKPLENHSWGDCITKATPQERESMFEALVELMEEEGEISSDEASAYFSESVQGRLPWKEPSL